MRFIFFLAPEALQANPDPNSCYPEAMVTRQDSGRGMSWVDRCSHSRLVFSTESYRSIASSCVPQSRDPPAESFLPKDFTIAIYGSFLFRLVRLKSCPFDLPCSSHWFSAFDMFRTVEKLRFILPVLRLACLLWSKGCSNSRRRSKT